ncbi:MAG: NADH-quinone oxidoreductase subunit L [Pirellulales bacterium]|nr:NADH-quinone oxidoreductase subunit L [Pirellulales bacterium]
MPHFDTIISILLALAWLLPLASFMIIVFSGRRLGKNGVGAGYLATGAIGIACVLSIIAMLTWLSQHYPPVTVHDEHAAFVAVDEHAQPNHVSIQEKELADKQHDQKVVTRHFYTLCEFGSLQVNIDFYIDALTIVMFVMVTLVATCIHIYSFGYMHEELKDVTDPLVKLEDGSNLKRRGRFFRFYQYFSLFCFSMLGLVIAGNIAMVFVFWELVGICSYLLIGFYIERKSASNAANKAFIVNRVGDFGMLVGMMVIWSTLGTFSFADIFEQVRPEHHDQPVAKASYAGDHETDEHADITNALIVPDGMVKFDARDEIEQIILAAPSTEAAAAEVQRKIPEWRDQGYGYWLLVLAGLGIFCGCVGKSAQFPLHVWLPDAMEGPTPVSALIHAATMVAAGVYLVGRFYPVFAPEVLLVIAYVGCFTLFMAATIAITATDIKRVLAYSTVSQLGYMTLSLGIGGWVAGLFHLITHAFFKSLLFLCSGSVIHACGTNEMPEMGGLRRKMPWTAATTMIGCLAISGAGIPLLFGLSGYHSKDSILAQAFLFRSHNPLHGDIFFWAATIGAALTATYMFRLWFMTFWGKTRSEKVEAHAHESPRVMVAPLVVLAVFAVIAGWNIPFTNIGAAPLIEQAMPAGIEAGIATEAIHVPAEHLSHADDVHVPVSLTAFTMAVSGFIIALAFYGKHYFNPGDVSRMFAPVYKFLFNKWYFDELYQIVFVRPTLWLSRMVAGIDRNMIDWFIDSTARVARGVSRIDAWIDRYVIDGLVDGIASYTYRTGLWLRTLQTGSLRQYVTFIVIGTVALFIIVSIYWNIAIAGH